MILECKSCQKKFVVPDNAITSVGRLVQCSSCGNKWTQFPISKQVISELKRASSKEKIAQPKVKKEKTFSTIVKKKKKVNLSSHTLKLFLCSD